jgi:periodic tryptophan protein 1
MMLASSLTWLPAGVSKSLPDVFEVEGGDDDSDGGNENNNESSGPSPSHPSASALSTSSLPSREDDVVMHYGLDTYDDEDNEAPLFAGGPKNLMAFKNNEDDPYITLPPEEDDEDLEDFVIRSTDLVMLTAVTEEDQLSHLDVVVVPEAMSMYTKSNDEATLRGGVSEAYVHHDYLLPAFPLTVQWLGVPSADTETGLVNLAAVGSFEPTIELWDLDVVDSPAPAYVLNGHTAAVISLHAHPSPQLRNLLASGSADGSVRLWDITRAHSNASPSTQSETQPSAACVQHLTVHGSDKVQAVRWHPSDPSVLCSASIGASHCAVVADVRQPDQALRYPLTSDAENLMWLDNQRLLISTEDGEVICFDVVAGKPLWRLDAHHGPCAGISLTAIPNSNPLVPILATCSPSKQSPLKLWVIPPNSGPRCIYSKTDALGKLFTVSFSYDLPFVLACGGQQQLPHFVNILEYTPVWRIWTGLDAIPTATPSSGGVSDMQVDSQFEDNQSSSSQPRKSKKKKTGKRH